MKWPQDYQGSRKRVEKCMCRKWRQRWTEAVDGGGGGGDSDSFLPVRHRAGRDHRADR